jgi:hypothetical protein
MLSSRCVLTIIRPTAGSVSYPGKKVREEGDKERQGEGKGEVGLI